MEDEQQQKSGIKTYNKEPKPRVAVAQPRVESATPEQEIEPQLIVKCPTETVVKSLKRPIPNYINQYEEENPAKNMQSKKHTQCTTTQEEILSAMERKSIAPTACQCARQNFQRIFLCDSDNAVMDANGYLLQYRHLMARL